MNPTVNRTPFVPQYFVVNTAMRWGVGAKPFIARVSCSMGGWLMGLMVDAVRAADTQSLRGSIFGVQTRATIGARFTGIWSLLSLSSLNQT
jgi:hypothetical protein